MVWLCTIHGKLTRQYLWETMGCWITHSWYIVGRLCYYSCYCSSSSSSSCCRCCRRQWRWRQPDQSTLPTSNTNTLMMTTTTTSTTTDAIGIRHNDTFPTTTTTTIIPITAMTNTILLTRPSSTTTLSSPTRGNHTVSLPSSSSSVSVSVSSSLSTTPATRTLNQSHTVPFPSDTTTTINTTPPILGSSPHQQGDTTIPRTTLLPFLSTTVRSRPIRTSRTTPPIFISQYQDELMTRLSQGVITPPPPTRWYFWIWQQRRMERNILTQAQNAWRLELQQQEEEEEDDDDDDDDYDDDDYDDDDDNDDDDDDNDDENHVDDDENDDENNGNSELPMATATRPDTAVDQGNSRAASSSSTSRQRRTDTLRRRQRRRRRRRQHESRRRQKQLELKTKRYTAPTSTIPTTTITTTINPIPTIDNAIIIPSLPQLTEVNSLHNTSDDESQQHLTYQNDYSMENHCGKDVDLSNNDGYQGENIRCRNDSEKSINVRLQETSPPEQRQEEKLQQTLQREQVTVLEPSQQPMQLVFDVSVSDQEKEVVGDDEKQMDLDGDDDDGEESVNTTASEDPNLTCTICFVLLQEGDRIGDLSCGHVFHVQCLKTWLPRRNTCPLCQAPNIATLTTAPVRSRRRRGRGGRDSTTATTAMTEQGSSSTSSSLITPTRQVGFFHFGRDEQYHRRRQRQQQLRRRRRQQQQQQRRLSSRSSRSSVGSSANSEFF